MYFELKKVKVFYGPVEALKGISLYLNEGEIVTLIGANGAGKTTALKSITALKRVNSGEILFNNKKISALDPHEIVSLGISMVPEGKHIFPYMSVKDNLLMGSYLIKDEKKISQNFERVYQLFPRLKERSKQMGGSLSGGEQQMLAIARSMMSSPKLLLLDEPSLGLAPILVKELMKTIILLNKVEKLSILLVEQNTKVALSVSNRGYILETGRIAIHDYSKNLINNDKVKAHYLGG